ncbi:hypothetical protein J2S43_001104 [Catenuloplanes nepalensis]|uniref:Uncharacterized protein n=1 Tax=Catenuloplanes nepalensis TaxID=587533 RepID=A0ABT9MMD8_9ACTN|nr:hypothetical protein [Catenuloplanes nepalensis]MDP9792592.1 hypothetical protein [Catenuloplanes nepalensis]
MPDMSDTDDLHALAKRPAPILALPQPWQEAHDRGDAMRAAMLDRLERASAHYATLTAVKAADMLRRLLPGAAHAVFEQDHAAECECTAHQMVLRLVRDETGAVLWYDDTFRAHPDVVRRDELEAYGGPVLPYLDTDSQEAIQHLITVAQHWDGPLIPTDEMLVEARHGTPVESIYDGDLYALPINEAITAATALIAAPPASVDLDRLAAVLAGAPHLIAAENTARLLDLVRADATAPSAGATH